MSLNSDKNLGNRLNIFNLINNVGCSTQLPKNPNNVRITNYILNCLKSKFIVYRQDSNLGPIHYECTALTN